MTNSTEKTAPNQTLGYFDIVAKTTIDDKTFAINSQGKNNKNWFSNIFNPKVEGDNGQSMYIRFQDGFDKINGRKIYVQPKSGTEGLEISWADKNNENILNIVSEKSFVKIGIKKEKVKNDEGKEFMQWIFKEFLTVYDAILYLQTIMSIGSTHKIRLVGRHKFNKFNDEINKSFELQTIYLLDNNEVVLHNGEIIAKPMDFKFHLTQNVLVMDDCIDKSKWDEEGIATLNLKVFQKKRKDKYELLPVKITVRADNEGKKITYDKVLDRYFKPDEDTIRRINLECKFNSGYVASNVNESELPEEALELIEDGLYTKEDVLKLYAIKDRIDEIVLVRPIIKKIEDKLCVDKSDDEFTKDNLKLAEIIDMSENEITIEEDNASNDDLLKELENL